MANNSLLEIKHSLDAHVGQKIMLRANGGRRKTVERTGVLEETYPSVFIVKLDQEQQTFKRVSYSYADILTASVEVTICGNNAEIVIEHIKV
ncbi:biofilm formation stimulator Veg [Paenibacillus sp. IHBB 10380]|jgi:uncharacterized protein Veg|uniref:biofilm formation stimulator Veg n=1 Tax=Paenibacillus sp. IHBB 10380 TaxID=1566358 RepID=UPI0005CFCF69|nr:Veg family protein [Paenibacillus sp. IHBB 10380]AJS60728.1 Veg protein [Paenibacillus sp. IHBB 10380]